MKLVTANLDVPFHYALSLAIERGDTKSVIDIKERILHARRSLFSHSEAFHNRCIWRAFIRQHPDDLCAKSVAEDFAREEIEYRNKNVPKRTAA